jgi:8-oxo-dGTP diphosphatase
MDRDCRVLLVHFDFVRPDLPTGLWACPGGGIEPGESPAQGLIRELHEEVGLIVADPGPPVWEKEHLFPMTSWDGQRDTFFFVEVDAFEPRPLLSQAELRAEHLDDLRWWDYDEIQTAQRLYDEGCVDSPDYVTFTPRRLGHLLADLLVSGRPPEPLHLDPL